MELYRGLDKPKAQSKLLATAANRLQDRYETTRFSLFPQSLSVPSWFWCECTGQKTPLKYSSGLNTSCTSRLSLSRLLFLSQESDLGFPADLPARDPAAAHQLNCAAAVAADGVSPP